ncbi:MAG: polysaccharide pyruvyl transferase family protein [Lachnospiraceae bacterium]|nr:polysaccharide pyruvyl transferase family protein [Lachnospiraceae bacterium]
MNNILLLDTSIGSVNQGDEIINLSIQKNWKSLFLDNYVMRLASHTPLYTPLQAFLYKKRLSVFNNADYKFLCGTNALYTNMLRPLPNWNINLFNCGLAKGTVCLGAGIGMNSKKVNWYTRALFNKVLSHDYVHSVRDERTKEFLESLGFKAENTGCPTLWGLTPEHCSRIPAKKGERVVFTLTYYNRDEKNDTAMIDILLKNYSEVYFWPQCYKDLEYLHSLTQSERITVITPNVAGYDAVLNVPGTDYVGNRLHGGIFALQHGCRAIIIAIDHRAIQMNENYSFECMGREDIPDSLEQRLNEEWETAISGLDFEKIEKWKSQFA